MLFARNLLYGNVHYRVENSVMCEMVSVLVHSHLLNLSSI